MTNQTSPQKRTPTHRLKPYGLKKRISSNSNWPLNEQAAAYVLMFGETLGYWGKRLYTGHTVSLKDGTWWLTVRATHKGKREVTFVKGETQADAIRNFGLGLVYDQLKWRPDKFKP